MKYLSYFLIILLIVFTTISKAAEKDLNVLTYYATSNYLDGQVYLDKTNILYFYPPFSIRNSVTEVSISLQHSGKTKPCCNIAEPMGKDSSYYSLLLPEFGLGESIIRLDVEVSCNLDKIQIIKSYFDLISKQDSIISEYEKQLNVFIDVNSISMDQKAVEIETIESTLKSILGNCGLDRENSNLLKPDYYISTVSKKIENLAKKYRKFTILSLALYYIKDEEDADMYNKITQIIDKDIQNIDLEIKQLTINYENSFNKYDQGYKTLVSTNYKDINNVIKNYLAMNSYKRIKIEMIKDLLASEEIEYNQYIKTTLESKIKEQEKVSENVDSLIYINNNTRIKGYNIFPRWTERALENFNGLTKETIKSALLLMRQRDVLNKTLSTLNEDESIARNNLNMASSQKDSLRGLIIGEVYSQLSDTSFTGSGIKKSDIVFNLEKKTVRILYRLKDYELRKRQALDPEEKRSIYRIRYVPFPITSTPNNYATHLVPFSGPGSNSVFEISVTMGNINIPSTLFFANNISLTKVGVGIALTPQLFDHEEADIIALLFCYDFSTYVSLGAGCNFAFQDITPYYSLGINKRAFEDLISITKELFTSE